MKIIVLHGEDTVKSYERLKKFIDTARERNWEVSFLDESSQGINENLSIPSLFGAERFFILRDVKKLGKKELTWITKNYSNLSGNLIIYHEGEIGKTILNGLPKDIKIEEFKLPKLIWIFLENIRPGNSKRVLAEFHKVIETEPPEFVFTLIARQFKNLYIAKANLKVSSIQPWLVARLKNQADKFTLEKIIEIIGILAEIDIKVKTGKADLVSALDLLILKQLE